MADEKSKKPQKKALFVKVYEDEFDKAIEGVKTINADLKFHEEGKLNSRDVRELLGLPRTRHTAGVKSQIKNAVKDLTTEDQEKVLAQIKEMNK